MIQVSGTYDNGTITLDETMVTDKPVKVIVTFMEGQVVEKKRLTLNDFSFLQSRRLLKDVKGNLSNAVTEERKSAL